MKTRTRKLARDKNMAAAAERRILAPRYRYLPGPVSLVSMTAIGMLMAQSAVAAVNCPPASSTTPVTCNVAADQGGIYEQITIDFLNDTEGLHPGNSGGDYTVINSAALSGTHSPICPSWCA